MDTGNHEQAIEYFQEALTKQKPKLNNVLRNLGICYTQLNQIDLAIDAYHKALENDPADIQAVISLGNIYENTGEYEKSLDYYNQALTVDPKSALAMNAMAMFYVDKKSPFCNPKTALEYSQQACRATDFKDKETLLLLIQILEQHEGLEESLNKDFLDKLNQHIARLKGAGTHR